MQMIVFSNPPTITQKGVTRHKSERGKKNQFINFKTTPIQ